MDFNALIKTAVDNGASDLHLQAGNPPIIRAGGVLRLIDAPPLSLTEMIQFISSIAPARYKEDVLSAARDGLDFSYEVQGFSRFRCSAFSTMGRLGMTMRTVRTQIPSIEQLNLPPVVRDVALSRRGLCLLTGTTGSGKSTTLAAMIDLINSTDRAKIITIEDPIEYIHTSKQALISQLEIGTDTPSFDQALRQALRQDPDVILVGELRDVETLRMALRAADTGHQVFATVHSARAAQTIERIIAMFPPAEHKLLLSQLSHSIEAIISQRLLATRDGIKRRPAIEILRGGPITERYVLEGKIAELTNHVGSGESGMQTFDQHILQLYQAQLITGTEALRNATRPEALAVAIRGIKYTGRAATS